MKLRECGATSVRLRGEVGLRSNPGGEGDSPRTVFSETAAHPGSPEAGRGRGWEICGDSADDDRAWRADGRNRLPVRPVRHGGRDDLDWCAVDVDAAAERDGAARDHADGIERLARLFVARAYPLATGVCLSDRLRARAFAV